MNRSSYDNFFKRNTRSEKPSSLAKNRLFVERNSRNKRVFGGFGSIFKSSTWSKYKSQNTTLNLVSSWWKTSLLTAITLFLVYAYFWNNEILYWVAKDCRSAADFLYLFFWRASDVLLSFVCAFVGCTFYFFRIITMKWVSFFYPNFDKYNSITKDYPTDKAWVSDEAKATVRNLKENVYKGGRFLPTAELFTTPLSDDSSSRFFKKLYSTEESLNQKNMNFLETRSSFLVNDILNLSYKSNTLEKNAYISKWDNSLNTNGLKFVTSDFDSNNSSSNSDLFFLNEKSSNYFKKHEYFKWLYKYSMLTPNSESRLDSINSSIQGIGSGSSKNNSFLNFYIDKFESNESNSSSFRDGVLVLGNSSVFSNNSKNWLKDYSNIHSSYMWSLNRTRFFNKPHFDSLDLSEVNSNPQKSLLNQSNDLLGAELLTLVPSTKTSTSLSNNVSSFVLNVAGKESLDYGDKNMIFRTFSRSNTSGSVDFFPLDLSFGGNCDFNSKPFTYNNFLTTTTSTQFIKDGNWVKDFYYYYL